MIGKVSFKIQGTTYQFEIENGDGLQLFQQMIVLGNPPTNCREIKKGVYSLSQNKDNDGNIYINMMCYGLDQEGKKSAYRSKLGTYKDKSGYFWNSWERDTYYDKRVAEKSSNPAPASTNSAADGVEDDIPF